MADRLEAGVYVALATPLDASGQLAEAVLERLVERVIADGVTGIAVLGSTGEAASLDDAVRRRVQERVAAQAGRRVTVLSGVNDTVLARLVQSLEQAADTGMAAALGPPGATVVTESPYHDYPGLDVEITVGSDLHLNTQAKT